MLRTTTPNYTHESSLIVSNGIETTFLVIVAAIMQSMNILEKIKHWYDGEYMVLEREDDKEGYPSYIAEYRHWTSHLAHFLVDSCVDHWRMAIGTTLVVIVIVVKACGG